jgi:hypothetical protein
MSKTTPIWFVLGESCFATFIDSGKGYLDRDKALARLEECQEHANQYPDPTRLSLQVAETEEKLVSDDLKTFIEAKKAANRKRMRALDSRCYAGKAIETRCWGKNEAYDEILALINQ